MKAGDSECCFSLGMKEEKKKEKEKCSSMIWRKKRQMEWVKSWVRIRKRVQL